VEDLLAGLRARQAAVRAVDLETRTTSWLGGQRVRATVNMLVTRDGRLAFQAEASLQGAVATLVADPRRFALLDLQAQRFQRGPSCPGNVASLIRIPLSAAEVAAILLGDAPLVAGARGIAVSWDPEVGADVLELAVPDGGRLWVKLVPAGDPAATAGRWRILGVEGATAGAAQRWRVLYEDLGRETATDSAVTHPGTIRFAEPGKDFDDGVEIKVRGRRVNPELPPTAFTLTPPEGFAVEEIDCIGAAPPR
jgi:hypothetical protein